MSFRPRSFRSLREFTSAVPKDAHKIFHELMDDPNDRASGITAAAYLESSLEDTLTFKLKKVGAVDVSELFRGDAPLGTFSAKIKFAFALQLFGERTRHDFDCIREVRNAFAHSKMKATFETPEIVNVCARISFPKWGRAPDEGDPRLVRIRFLASATLYYEVLAEMAKPGNHQIARRWLRR